MFSILLALLTAVPLPNDELPMPVIDFAVTSHLRQLPATRHPLPLAPLLSLYVDAVPTTRPGKKAPIYAFSKIAVMPGAALH
jgi:hypothetical protein